MNTINITYIISDIDKALAFEWVATYLDKDKFHLSFILLNPGPSQLENFLVEQKVEVHRVTCRGKKDWLPAIFKTRKLLKQLKTDIVHCHLLQANIIGLTAAKLTGTKKRIYTRHHSSLHHVHHKKGIWWDKLANKQATQIVAISGIVKKILLEWEKAPASKVVLIPHGFLLEQFTNVADDRIEHIRQRYMLTGKGPIIGVISRFTEWKGVQYIIPAFKSLLNNYPDAILLLMNAKGDYEKELHDLLLAIPDTNYRLIAFEPDVAAAYHAMDVFVHVPIDEHSEAFGQIYVEALVAGVPSVFTRSGIANDPEFNSDIAIFVDYKNSDQIYNAINNTLINIEHTAGKVAAGKIVSRNFNLDLFIKKLEKLYSGNL